MSFAIPNHETATHKELFRFFVNEASMMRLGRINEYLPGNLLDYKQTPDTAFMDEEGYVFDVSVADMVVEAHSVQRYYYVFLRDGTVSIRVGSPLNRIQSLPSWRDGVHSIFTRVSQTLEFLSEDAIAGIRDIRPRMEQYAPFQQTR